jgi:hypothetical protein
MGQCSDLIFRTCYRSNHFVFEYLDIPQVHFVFVANHSGFDFIFLFRCESENNVKVLHAQFNRLQP